MPDSKSSATGKAQKPEFDAGHVPMTEEMDDLKHTLPNFVPVLGALVVIAIIIAGAAYLLRAKPVASGAIENVFAVEQNSHTTSFVAINVNVRNVTEKTLYIKDIQGEITTPSGKFTDNAANAVDYGRYVAAYPDLGGAVQEPLKVETKIAPGGSAAGTVLVNFPITKADFDKRTSVAVTIIPYDHAPFSITGK